MSQSPLTLHSWPRAILHVDADAFFASCEQALHPELRGKPVITGQERGIVAAASYEAKQRGVQRGMRLHEVRRVCPDAVILPNDYETYSLFSLRLFDLLRRFTPQVEEYSIDEAFADLTGMRRVLRGSYGEIAQRIQQTIAQELGISVSIGVSLSKVLAKIASRWKKPQGVTAIPGREIHHYLAHLPVEKVWGIGPNTAALLAKQGVATALEFARCQEAFIRQHYPKPILDLWYELNGESVLPVLTDPKTQYQSITKGRTFTPPRAEADYLFAQLVQNLEDACLKARRYHLAARRLVVLLRTQDFQERGIELRLTRASAYPSELLEVLRTGFATLYQPRNLYRATGVVLTYLVPQRNVQFNLFEDAVRVEQMARVYQAMDHLAERYGRHTVHLGASLLARRQAQHAGERGTPVPRQQDLVQGETRTQHLGLPRMEIAV